MGRKPRGALDNSPKKLCLKCQKERHLNNDFYTSYSSLHGDGKLPICKSCLLQMTDINDINSIKSTLRQIDRPFIDYVWEKSKESDKHPIGVYLKNIAMPQFRTWTWDDSKEGGSNTNVKKSKSDQKEERKSYNYDFNDEEDEEFEVTRTIVQKWGGSYSPEDYRQLEEFYQRMKNSYEIETASHVDYLKKICKVSLKMEQAVDIDNIDDFKKLSDVYDKLMHSAKFTAVQRSSSDRSGGLNTFSEFFALIETEGFIPKFHTDEPMDIVDTTLENLKKFTKTLVLGDSNISQIVEESIQKMNERALDKELEIDINEDTDIEDMDDDYEDIDLDFEEDDL